jgi:hypothetical protein
MLRPTPSSQIRQLQVSQVRRERDVYQTEEFTGRPHVCSGQFMMEGIGEVLVDVKFPVFYLEMPLLSFGAALEENQSVVLGSVPTISVVATRYDYKLSRTGARLYRGAQLGVVATGSTGHRLQVHWHFTGMALVNPVQQNSIDQVV